MDKVGQWKELSFNVGGVQILQPRVPRRVPRKPPKQPLRPEVPQKPPNPSRKPIKPPKRIPSQPQQRAARRDRTGCGGLCPPSSADAILGFRLRGEQFSKTDRTEE